jgi:hypothetical protein
MLIDYFEYGRFSIDQLGFFFLKTKINLDPFVIARVSAHYDSGKDKRKKNNLEV